MLLVNGLNILTLTIIASFLTFGELSTFDGFGVYGRGILLRVDAEQDLLVAFRHWHIIGVQITGEWVLASAVHLKRIATNSKDLTSSQFVIYQQKIEELPHFANHKLVSVTEIKVNEKFAFDKLDVADDGFLLRIAERIPYGMGPVQWFHKPPAVVKTGRIFTFGVDEQGAIESYLVDVQMAPNYNSTKECIPAGADLGYCVQNTFVGENEYDCNDWFFFGAPVIANNLILGLHQDGGLCCPFRAEFNVGFKIVSIATTATGSMGDFMRANVVDARSAPVLPLKKAHKSKSTTLDPNTKRSLKKRSRLKPTAPFSMHHWWNWDTEDCDSAHVSQKPILIIVIVTTVLGTFWFLNYY